MTKVTKDDLGDRMKLYEGAEAGRRLMPLLPILARLDGRSFSKFTRGMERPYDSRMSRAMIDTTMALVEETGAVMGYTQSDEITLAWLPTQQSQVWFDGRIQKMTSQLAAQGTVHFYRRVIASFASKWADRMPTFDARVWNVPSPDEGANVFLWREWDATKNSVSMAVSEHYSHKVLQGKTRAERHEMLFQKGINWNDYPTYFKRGTYAQRKKVNEPFTFEEIDSLPPKHAARTDPTLRVERSIVRELELPPLGKIVNRSAVIFEGAEPITVA